ncbi:MAG: PHP domain-containing protein [Clostridiales bacterium]|nr:PHP domain-containing protein [Clostridiales bacterium]
MEQIDLHIHTSASDGTLSPQEVVSRAQAKGLKAVAITDHDTVRGIIPSEGPLEVIPGIELSAEHEGKEIHVLGYFINPFSKELNDELKAVVDGRNQRNESIILRMAADGYMVSVVEINEKYPNAVIGRPHIAAELVEKGYAPTIKHAFNEFLGQGRPYYLPRIYLPFDRAVELIRNAGGISVLAHPMQYRYDESELLQLIVRLKEAGVWGLEAYHPSHLPEDTVKIRTVAEKFNMAITGGSDFHGGNLEGIDIGCMAVPANILDSLKLAAGDNAGDA